MAGLKPFREIPTNIVEWTKWMRAQETGGSVATSTVSTTTVDGTTTTTTTTASRWTVEDFSGHYVLNASDAGKIKRSTGGSATNVTVPAGIFTEGDQVVIYQYGAGVVTLVAGSGTTLDTPSTLVFNEQYGSVTIILTSNNAWMVAGRMAP